MAHIRMNSYGFCALSPIYREITLECIQKILHRDHTDSGKNITRKSKQRCFDRCCFFHWLHMSSTLRHPYSHEQIEKCPQLCIGIAGFFASI